jgi:hypothetical protein
MNLDDLINRQGLSWEPLDGELNAKESQDFIRQFKDMFSCQRACVTKNVVYVWVTQKCIPRLCGKSNIIYFGKTVQTLHRRHYGYASTEGDPYNWHRYEHIIKIFGPIKIYFAVTSNPKDKESELLKKYYEDHCEYPPANRVSGKRT